MELPECRCRGRLSGPGNRLPLKAMDTLRVLDALDARRHADRPHFRGRRPHRHGKSGEDLSRPGRPADYLLVKKPPGLSRVFDQTPLAELFKRNRVPILELPIITATTIQAIQDASAEKKKHLTYSEAEKLPAIHQMCRFEIEYFLNRIFTQCEDVARVWLPTLP